VDVVQPPIQLEAKRFAVAEAAVQLSLMLLQAAEEQAAEEQVEKPAQEPAQEPAQVPVQVPVLQHEMLDYSLLIIYWVLKYYYNIHLHFSEQPKNDQLLYEPDP
jgi:hypothetical protein